MIVFKYKLEITPEQVIETPPESVFLALQEQDGLPTLWMLCMGDLTPVVKRRILIHGTGHLFEPPAKMGYIGTVQIGGFVWHVFEDHDDSPHSA